MSIPSETELLQEQLETQFAVKYPHDQYLYFVENDRYKLMRTVLEYFLGNLTEDQLMRLNLPQFATSLKPLLEEFQFQYSEGSALFPEYGEKRIKQWHDPFEEPPIIYYAILSKEEYGRLQSELNQVPLKKYIRFLQKLFIEPVELITNKWGYDKVPFLIADKGALKFYNLSTWHVHDWDVRIKTGRFPIKNEFRFSFKVKKGDQSWDITISKADSEVFKDTFSFEWYETEQYLPLIIFNVPIHVPKVLWNITILLAQKLLKAPQISDGVETYTIPVIAFEINRPYFLLGEPYFVQKVFSESFIWRDLQIYYPPDQSALLNFIQQGLSILDGNEISFLPEYLVKMDAIIFSYGIQGLNAGQVSVEFIGGKYYLFIDLDRYAGLKLEVVLHELLHKTSASSRLIKPVRESFTTLATYLLLPEGELQKFQQEVLAGESLRGYHFAGSDLAYTIFPIFLYQTFCQENPAAFVALYLSHTVEEILAKLPDFFAEKLFYEELSYLCDFSNAEKYLEYDDDYLYEEHNTNHIVLQLLAIYFFKEELTENFTYMLTYLSSRRAGFQQKGMPKSQANFKYHDLDPYIRKLPPSLLQAVRKILTSRA
jgi:hypothetical protein